MLQRMTRDWLDYATFAVNVLLLIVAVVALVYGGKQAAAAVEANRSAKGAATDAARQRERDSYEQTRAYVFAQVVPGLGGQRALDIVLQNHGKTTARNVTVVTADWGDGDDEWTSRIQRACDTPQTLPPGGRVRFLWQRLPPEKDKHTETFRHIGALTVGTGVVRFTDYEGACHEEPFNWDSSLANIIPLSTLGKTTQSSENEELKNVINALRNIGHHIGELRR